MTPRQRVRAVLNRTAVDRTPVDLWLTAEALAALAEHTGLETEMDVYRKLGVDKIPWFLPSYVGPMRALDKEDEITDAWGFRMKKVQAGPAVYYEHIEHPLRAFDAPESLDEYPWWPDPAFYDYDAMVRDVDAWSSDFSVMAPWVSVFEVYCGLRGLEQAFVDLFLNPDYVTSALDRIESVQSEMLDRFLSRVPGKVDLVFVSDDMGNQSGLMISVDTWREHIGPRLRRLCEIIHSHGTKVFYHSDGAVRPLIPLLLDAGVDVLNPVQHACPGMDCAGLNEEFGERLIFHGGIDNQHTLPFGSVKDVREETRMCLNTLGQGGGYICCSCHNIQAGTPTENILALIETVHEHR